MTETETAASRLVAEARPSAPARVRVEHPEPSPREKFGGCGLPLSLALTQGSAEAVHYACGEPLSQHTGVDAQGAYHHPPKEA